MVDDAPPPPASSADPGYEVVNNVSLPVATPTRARPVPAKAVERPDDEDDRPRSYQVRDDDDDRPPSRRQRDEDDRPRKRPLRKKPREAEKSSSFGLERKVLSGGVLGGLLAMVIAAVWFVLGLMADRIFFYPPILFVLGLIAMIRGAAGGNDD
ncbi:hypothetical protein FRUB_04677 [Fimbriiglobus ruber]|uniref:Uncharacterized protein n=1 Tax=Fimbriiglobus ruber TaxID=1908690 RepID=A0A225DWT4_9BACT|nr:hypothetical protein FRUB_04677 [Fimbriiglobus ruber]